MTGSKILIDSSCESINVVQSQIHERVGSIGTEVTDSV